MKKIEYKGYAGKILCVNLTTQTTEVFPLSDEDKELYLGGKILAAKILYQNITHKIEPLAEENIIVVTTCPLTANGSPSSSRFNISTISPLTGFCTSSNSGGNFGMHLKRSGYDAMIIKGKSATKVYISITADKIEFLDATELWGLTTGATQAKIGGRSGKIVIGPAGENLVKYACVISEERANGRGGVGAVFGSKNLKGVVATGSINPEPFNKEKLKAVNKMWVERLTSHPLTGVQMPKLGTAGLVAPMQVRGLLATKNYKYGSFDGFEKISGEAMAEEFLVKNKGCLTCPIQCGRMVKVKGETYKGPEVETLGLLGANILNDNLELILEWNHLLDELGMDTISCANTLSFAMELQEKGMWDSGLHFGKTDNITQVIEDIAHRKGIGDILAEGSKRVAQKFGGEDFAMNAKGMELAAYEPRSAVGQGLGYAVSNRGGCHLNGGYLVVLEGLGLDINPRTTHSKATLTIMFQNLMEAVSAGGSCLFTTYAFFPKPLMAKPNSAITKIANLALPFTGPIVHIGLRFPKILSINLPHMLPHPLAIQAATGIKMNMGKLLQVGERGYCLERLLNIKLGMTASDDTLPKRLTAELKDSNDPKSVVPLAKLKKKYYKVRGWTQDAMPKKSLVKRLKLGEL
ncbi:MAG: aldehyde ferredoxin oxidoreductase family protein [Clostridia bacterium]